MRFPGFGGRVHSWLGRLFDLALPAHCLYCREELTEGEKARMLCGRCAVVLRPAVVPRCRTCGGLSPVEGAWSAGCPHCWRYKLGFESTAVLGPYSGGLRDAVLRMKRANGESLSWAVGRLLAERFEQWGTLTESGGPNPMPDLVVPVPMFWLRRAWRGVNSAEILARCLAQRTGARLATGLLVRRRNTKPQKDLGIKERFRNVRGAFRLKKCYDVEKRCVLLVDDIMTTGATCGALAQLLKGAGAASVTVAVAARADGLG